MTDGGVTSAHPTRSMEEISPPLRGNGRIHTLYHKRCSECNQKSECMSVHPQFLCTHIVSVRLSYRYFSKTSISGFCLKKLLCCRHLKEIAVIKSMLHVFYMALNLKQNTGTKAYSQRSHGILAFWMAVSVKMANRYYYCNNTFYLQSSRMLSVLSFSII